MMGGDTGEIFSARLDDCADMFDGDQGVILIHGLQNVNMQR